MMNRDTRTAPTRGFRPERTRARMSVWLRSVAPAVVLVAAFPLQVSAQILDDILSRVNAAVSAAGAARAAAEEMRTSLRAGISDLTGDLRTMIDEAAEDARRTIQEEREGLDDFAPGGQCAATCTAFRANLIALLTSIDELSTGVTEATASPQPSVPQGDLDLSPLIAAVEAAPGRVLYPIYRVSSTLINSDLRDRLETTVDQLRVLRTVVLNGPPALPDSCTLMLSQSETVERASYGVTSTAAIVGLVGRYFSMTGETQFEGSAAVWGWVGGTIKSNKDKKVAEALAAVSDGMSKVSTYAHNKLRYCSLLAFQDQTSAALAGISSSLAGLNLDLSNLDTTVSSRATQESVDGLHTSLQRIGTDVATLVQVGGSGGDGNPVGLRIQIERELSTRGSTMSVFYLPESFGGLLELVREIVADSLAQHEAAGYPVDNAWRLLERGDAAQAQLDYRSSYAWYQAAYQRVTSQRPEKREK